MNVIFKLIAAGGVCAISGMASATTIQIDIQGTNSGGFASQDGPIAAAAPGTWNIVNVQAADGNPSSSTAGPVVLTGLLDDTGVATGVGFSLDNNASTLLGWAGRSSENTDGLTSDYLLFTGGDVLDVDTGGTSFSITGLTANTQYFLTFYSGLTPNNINRGVEFFANGVSTQVFADDGLADPNGNSVSTIAVISDGSGVIGGSANNITLSLPEGNWAGLVISDVPEPGSLALLGLGGLMLYRRRRL